jgi:hypothetical protein
MLLMLLVGPTVLMPQLVIGVIIVIAEMVAALCLIAVMLAIYARLARVFRAEN